MNFRRNFCSLRCVFIVVCLVPSVKAVTSSPEREVLRRRFATVSSGTVISDRSKLDQVEEESIKRGQEEITTEVIEDHSQTSSLPHKTTIRSARKLEKLTNRPSQNHQVTFLKERNETKPRDKQTTVFGPLHNVSAHNSFFSAGKKWANGRFGENSTLNSDKSRQNSSTLQVDGWSSLRSQRKLNKSSVAKKRTDVDSLSKNLVNSSQNFKTSNTRNELWKSQQNVNNSGSVNHEIYKLSLMRDFHIVNTSFGQEKTSVFDINRTEIALKMSGRRRHGMMKISNGSQSDITQVMNNNRTDFKGIGNRENISEEKSEPVGSNNVVTDSINGTGRNKIVKEIDLDKTNSTSIKLSSTKLSDTQKPGVLNTSISSNVSESKKTNVDELDNNMDVLLKFSDSGSGTGRLKELSSIDNPIKLSPIFRRMNILHRNTSTKNAEILHNQSKASRKLQSFLSVVKQMFNEPETVEDILAWESWGPCSRLCDKGAVRSRQRKCGRLVQRNFHVACPEPREERQKCPLVSCSAKKSKHQQLNESKKNFEVGTEPSHQNVESKDNTSDQIPKKNVDSPRVQLVDSPVVDNFPGTEHDGVLDEVEVGDSPRIATEDETEADENLADDNEGVSETDDERLNDRSLSNIVSIQTANQRKYLYTVWGSWSACTRTCGQQAYAFRKRYCINAVSGELKRRCQRPTILAKKCLMMPCPVDGGLSNWSNWSSCSGDCGIMERHRSCTNPKPAFGGKECFKLPVQMRLCGSCQKEKIEAVQKLTAYSPKFLCGFDPCQRVGCLANKGAICVTDFECNPTFFDETGQVLKRCKDSAELFLRPLAQKKCSFNPCSFTKCNDVDAKCLVDTECRPFFINEMGKRVKCKGSNVLQISSELICGFNPCKITTCAVDPDARCVTDYRCNPLFIDAAGQRISGCPDNEVEEGQRLTVSRSRELQQQNTENPAVREQTAKQHTYPSLPHHLQKHRQVASTKKTILENLKRTNDKLKNIRFLEDVLHRRLHQGGSLKYDNAVNFGDLHIQESEKPRNFKYLESVLERRLHQNKSLKSENSSSSRNLQKFQDDRLKNIKFLESALERKLYQHGILVSENLTSSGYLEGVQRGIVSKNVRKENANTNYIKPLDRILQHRVHRNESLGLKSRPTSSTKLGKLNAENVFQSFSQNNNENNSESFVRNPSDKNQNSVFELYLSDEKNSNKGISTVYTSDSGATEFVDGPLTTDKLSKFAENRATSEPNAILERPLDLKEENAVHFEDKPFQATKNTTELDRRSDWIDSRQQQVKKLADVDKFILDKLYHKKMIENAGWSSLRPSDVDQDAGKIESTDHMSNYNFENKFGSKVNGNSGEYNTGLDSHYNNGKIKGNNTFYDILLSNINITDNNSYKQTYSGLYSKKPSSDINNNIKNSVDNLKTTKSKNENDIAVTNKMVNKNESIKNINLKNNKKANKNDVFTNKLLSNNDDSDEVNIISGLKTTNGENSRAVPFKHFSSSNNELTKARVNLGSFQDSSDAADKNKEMNTVDERNAATTTADAKNDIKKNISNDKSSNNYAIVNDPKYPLVSRTQPLVVNLKQDKLVNQTTGEKAVKPVADMSSKTGNSDLISKPVSKIGGEKLVNQIGDKILINQVAAGKPVGRVIGEEPVNHVHQVATDKTINQVSDTSFQSADLISKLVLKAVEKEIAKLGVDEVLDDAVNRSGAPKIRASEATSGSQESTNEHLGATENPIGTAGNPRPPMNPKDSSRHLGVAEKPMDYEMYKELLEELDKTVRLGLSTDNPERYLNKNRRLNVAEKPSGLEKYVDMSGHLGIDEEPMNYQTYEELSEPSKMVHSEVTGRPNDDHRHHGVPIENHHSNSNIQSFEATNTPIFRDKTEEHLYHEQGGAPKDSSHQGDDSSSQVDDEESLREINEWFKHQEDESTTAKPSQTTHSPMKIAQDSSSDYIVTMGSANDGDINEHADDHGITDVNEGHQVRKPEYRDLFSPSLLDEISELGLNEYYIKDGFQTPLVAKDRKVDEHENYPTKYKKKFHLGQVEILSKGDGNSALRQHDSNGDEIERVPSRNRDDDGIARSYTTGKSTKVLGSSHLGSLTKYLDNLRHDIGDMDSDILHSGLKGKRPTEEDLENAIILTAMDDGLHAKLPRKQSFATDDLGDGVIFADDDGVSKKDGLMAYKSLDDDDESTAVHNGGIFIDNENLRRNYDKKRTLRYNKQTKEISSKRPEMHNREMKISKLI